MKNKKLIIGIVAVVGVIAIAASTYIGMYNSIINLEENLNKSFSDIDADLQRRNDLIPNLVESVKAYASHEEEIFTDIADARGALLGANTIQDTANADAAMNTAVSRLMMIAESYPDLKANENFINLQTQLEGTENRIKVARTKYNEAAQEFNTKIRSFPTSIIASTMGVEKAEYFNAEQGANEVPEVSFD